MKQFYSFANVKNLFLISYFENFYALRSELLLGQKSET